MASVTEEQKEAARMRVREEMASQQNMNQMESLAHKREQIMANNVLHMLQGVESKMDEDLQKMNDLASMSEADLDSMRDKRKEQLRKLAAKKTEWRAQGHGEYREVKGEKEFFAEVKNSERVVVHFFRSASIRCNVIDRHFSDLAPEHLETKFIKIDAEKSPFLVERLHIWMMPSIVICINGRTEHTIAGLDEFGGVDDFSTEMCAYVLGTHKAINHHGKAPEDPTSSESAVSRFEKRSKSVKQSAHSKTIDQDDDWWD
uniref:Thioredoxin domain-containing protein n=1 Tax=Aplanochytrium stocchinoi TaxID=215587 RepID=A0A7S3PCV8_9STRA|mmetsp:Transcript_18910/g.23188  ORF Transcript_18910/g.23188 Transcript_18910/m.23188 type:complete len:259 (+) Transcript_18910:139-915(+)|eukprot:CAMPEP_0204829008 /NCGR_PEP_ID=MMETSP1346-20131115/6986_1 /ASSEMBLY_ACC=CAM_ASM_000771 /TAXON_ID=215587 /ORGANISM="Aplanochytrium stocchinoi, Strain GSBS06" /LENGTH=258 /DNA_ID=CAMNT_0051958457 /DNA_START=117 /DNA_END=893 /DNA_ORIENTATION=-